MLAMIGKWVRVALWATLFSSAAFAQNNYNNNNSFGAVGGGAALTNWAYSSRWSSGNAPASGQGDINITNIFLQTTTITNASGTGLNYLRIISGNGAASSNVTVITSGDLSSTYGVRIGQKSALIVSGGNATFGSNANNSFDLGGGGTLAISNNANVFVSMNADVTADGGTINFAPGSGQNNSLNYAPTAHNFINGSGNTILMSGAGSASIVGNFGGTLSGQWLQNSGSIIVQAGTLRIDPRNAYDKGGFQNTSTGFVQVNTNTVLQIGRTSAAWTGGSVPTNFGSIFINGGELRTVDTDSGAANTNTSRVIVNGSGGTIRGNGLLDFTVANQNVIEARAGTLSVVASTGNAGTWVSTNYGGIASVLNFASGNFDLGGGTLLNTNGTVRMISGANVTLSTSYRQNWGTLDFAGSVSLFVANSGSAGSLTNEWVIKKTAAGTATLTTGFGSLQSNYGLYNNGTINISSGDRFIINTSNSFANPFINALSGTVFVGGSSTVRLSRTTAAWNGGTLPLNSGTITLSGGVLETADESGLTSGRFIRNAGMISGSGTINASVTNVSGGVISPGLSLGTLNIGGAVVFGSNSTLRIELGVPGQNDLVTIAGIATIDSSSILNITGGSYGNIYTVMTYAAETGTFGTVSPGYVVAYNPNNITLEVVPEPSTLFLTLMGVGLAVRLRSRRQSR
jgi:hypothetical protein